GPHKFDEVIVGQPAQWHLSAPPVVDVAHVLVPVAGILAEPVGYRLRYELRLVGQRDLGEEVAELSAGIAGVPSEVDRGSLGVREVPPPLGVVQAGRNSRHSKNLAETGAPGNETGAQIIHRPNCSSQVFYFQGVNGADEIRTHDLLHAMQAVDCAYLLANNGFM